jgi:ribosomal protein S12 methylthiotransferase accessory factor
MDMVSSRVGIIRSVSRVGRAIDEPNPPVIYQATVSNFDFRSAEPIDRIASGKGETDADAMHSAIGEALERYCASLYDPSSFRKIALADLDADRIHPRECVLYSERQYARKQWPYRRADEKAPIAWVKTHELPGRNEVLVPASLIYLNCIAEQREDFFAPPTSNGLAAGPNLTAATLSGLYELIERDAFLITWMNRLPAPRVEFSSLTGLPKSIRNHYRQFGVEPVVFNLTLDIPVYVMAAATIERSGPGPHIVIGLGCNLNPVAALKKALMEVCQVRPGEVARYIKNPPRERLHSYADVHTVEDHSGFAGLPERFGEFSFLLENGRSQQVEDLANHSTGQETADLDFTVESLRAAGCRVLQVDVTTPDLQPFDVRVVRTIATGLQPMHFGYGEERLGGHRLYEVPQTMGYYDGIRTEDDLNPCPHPLA